VRYLERKKSIT